MDRKTFWIALSTLICMLMGCSSLKTELPASAQTKNLIWQPQEQLAWDQVKLPGKRETQYSLDTQSHVQAWYGTIQLK